MGSVPQCLAGDQDGVGAQRGDLAGFRVLFYESLNARADGLFELADALLCADGPVRSLVERSLAPEHCHGHGALYDGLNHGSIEIARLRRGVAGLALTRVGDRIVLAVDVSPWLRPDAETSAQRRACHFSRVSHGSPMAFTYHRGSRPGKRTTRVFRAVFQPCVPVPDSPLVCWKCSAAPGTGSFIAASSDGKWPRVLVIFRSW